MTKAEIKYPDFAYPKSTATTADQELAKAIQNHDAKEALKSLIIRALAQNMVDPDSLQSCLNTIESTAQSFSDSPLYGIFDALQGTIYAEFYSQYQWKYDRRELPLTPYPSDITEWSGEQFQAKIDELLQNSVSEASLRQLIKLKIEDYADIIEVDEKSRVFFPTLADFALANASKYSYDISKDICLKALNLKRDDVAPEIFWQSKIEDFDTEDDIMPLGYIDDEEESLPTAFSKDYNRAKDLYMKYKSSMYSGLLLEALGNKCRSLEERAQFISIGDEYLKLYPQSIFKLNIQNIVERYTMAEVDVRFHNICGSGYPFKVDINNSNAIEYSIDIYWISDTNDSKKLDNRSIQRIIASSKPVKSKKIECDSKIPFRNDTSATFTLEDPGYYVVTPMIPGMSNSREWYSVLRCVPVYPVSINGNDNKALLLTLNPATGAPMPDLKVSIKDRKNVKATQTSDADGIATFSPAELKNYSLISIKYGGKKYPFDNLSLYTSHQRDADYTTQTARILTDRALYHPGEELNVLTVCSERTERLNNDVETSLLTSTPVKICLRNANYQIVDTLSVTTDDYGRGIAKFSLPTDGLTGEYTVQVLYNDRQIGTTRVTVSDYKLPDFELIIDAIECDTPNKGDVTVTGHAITYSGMPLADADVNLRLLKCNYWWRAYQGDEIYTTEIKTDEEGKFSTVIEGKVFTDTQANTCSVILNAVSITGTTATAESIFALSEKYSISLGLPANIIEPKTPLIPEVKVYAADGTQTEIALVWSIAKGPETVLSGDFYGQIDISALKPGTYTLYVESKEKGLASSASASFTVYDTSTVIVPDDEILWTKDSRIECEGGRTADILLGTSSVKTYVYAILSNKGSITSSKLFEYAKGYHTMSIPLPEDCESASLELITVNDCQTYTKDIAISVTKKTGIKIIGESFRDNLVPGAVETWKIRLVNADGSKAMGAMALDMYNKALEALESHSFILDFYTGARFSTLNVNSIGWYSSNNFTQKIPFPTGFQLKIPDFNTYGQSWTPSLRIRGLNSPMMKMSLASNDMDMAMEEAEFEVMPSEDADYSVSADMAVGAASPTEEITVETYDEGNYDDATQAPKSEIDYRDSYVPLAVWAPSLTTDTDGNICYSFTVPNANTTWVLQAVAWTKDLQTGRLIREFVASKPLMVQPNLPRFMRSGDKATVLASIMNNSDTTDVVTTLVEIFNPLNSEVITQIESVDTIAPKTTAKVAIDVKAAMDMSAFGYRIKATNGTFTDGEQSVVPILPSEASLIETYPFYLNPGETHYNTTLPKEKNSRLTLTFCENPAWTIVTALPGLRQQISEYANSAAAALYSGAIARGIIRDNPNIGKALKIWTENPTDSALISMLQKNEDLKAAVLNSTPWVQTAQSDTERMANLAMIFDDKEVDASIAQAINILIKLQRADGGWTWAKWCDESSVWVTSNVLSMLGDLKQLGWLPNDKELQSMIKKAIKYYDRKVEKTDLLYCLTRPYFNDIPVSSNGKKVIAATLAEIKSDWKKHTDPAYKAMEAEALYLNGDKPLANELMKSISEFGVMTKDQGLKFPSVNALYNYAILLEAYGMIKPGSKEVDGLRQQLIVRKQATDWGDAVVTTEVVKSILSTGTKWTVDVNGAEVMVDDTKIEPQGAIETSTGWIRADLSAYRGKTLSITTPGVGPAYGAVYAQFDKEMADVKASACDDLDIEKQLFVRRGSEWQVADYLRVGNRVKVQLTIHCKRNLQYVTIVDERPATFEPVQQLPGWMWSEGVGFYRENRDDQTDLHVIYMRPGTYLLTYEMNVNLAGQFSSGVATIQSQYAPEISAHSSGSVINVD